MQISDIPAGRYFVHPDGSTVFQAVDRRHDSLSGVHPSLDALVAALASIESSQAAGGRP